MKRCLIIYYSCHHGNTEKVANAMAEVTKATVLTVFNVNESDIKNYDVIGIGSGIAYGKHYSRLIEAADRLNLKGKKVFVFSTSGTGNPKFNSALIARLKRKGVSVVGSFACKGFDTNGPLMLIGGIAKGHPNKNNLNDAHKFVQRITQ